MFWILYPFEQKWFHFHATLGLLQLLLLVTVAEGRWNNGLGRVQQRNSRNEQPKTTKKIFPFQGRHSLIFLGVPCSIGCFLGIPIDFKIPSTKKGWEIRSPYRLPNTTFSFQNAVKVDKFVEVKYWTKPETNEKKRWTSWNSYPKKHTMFF